MSGETLHCICFYCLAPRAALTVDIVVPLLYGLKVGAIQVYPSSAAIPDAVLIPFATVTNGTWRWARVCLNAAQDEKKQENMYFPVKCI